MCAKNYFNIHRFYEVIAKIRLCSFLPHSVVCLMQLSKNAFVKLSSTALLCPIMNIVSIICNLHIAQLVNYAA